MSSSSALVDVTLPSAPTKILNSDSGTTCAILYTDGTLEVHVHTTTTTTTTNKRGGGSESDGSDVLSFSVAVPSGVGGSAIGLLGDYAAMCVSVAAGGLELVYWPINVPTLPRPPPTQSNNSNNNTRDTNNWRGDGGRQTTSTQQPVRLFASPMPSRYDLSVPLETQPSALCVAVWEGEMVAATLVSEEEGSNLTLTWVWVVDRGGTWGGKGSSNTSTPTATSTHTNTSVSVWPAFCVGLDASDEDGCAVQLTDSLLVVGTVGGVVRAWDHSALAYSKAAPASLTAGAGGAAMPSYGVAIVDIQVMSASQFVVQSAQSEFFVVTVAASAAATPTLHLVRAVLPVECAGPWCGINLSTPSPLLAFVSAKANNAVHVVSLDELVRGGSSADVDWAAILAVTGSGEAEAVLPTVWSVLCEYAVHTIGLVASDALLLVGDEGTRMLVRDWSGTGRELTT